MHKSQPNILHTKFFEIPNLQYAMAFCWFQKGSVIQKLLHELKYGGNEELGVYLGEMYGKELREYGFHEKFDIITSVPLHFIKYRKRGFNQSDKIAEGLSLALEVPFKKLLKKEVHGKSQTKKHRLERFANVESTFSLLATKSNIKEKNILVIDDVLTTGATIQAACQPLIEKGAKISILTIAVTK
ncbi:ComF family protein [Marivirga sp. S37H4]|uniref:ComF family protein n=1 Tax=Marivirga aurantiaca TaxID=2802615 RepID=A0A934X1A9_9BACT|nr:phosphoribosyltransferase family protein [Marivirga aurantiaca]MBK6267143.1 ComF family protein [Marivirga aurantiaca]